MTRFGGQCSLHSRPAARGMPSGFVSRRGWPHGQDVPYDSTDSLATDSTGTGKPHRKHLFSCNARPCGNELNHGVRCSAEACPPRSDASVGRRCNHSKVDLSFSCVKKSPNRECRWNSGAFHLQRTALTGTWKQREVKKPRRTSGSCDTRAVFP